jgi:hypothetical protein
MMIFQKAVSMQSIEAKLQILRLKWKKHPEQREVIERQAKALLYAKRAYKIPSKEKHEKRVSEVIESLLE